MDDHSEVREFLRTRRSAIDRQKQIELAKARNMPHPIGFNYKQTPSEA